METKTKDGILIEKVRVETMAMILAHCSEEKMETLGVKENLLTMRRDLFQF